MNEAKKRRRPRKPQYKYHPGSTSVTVYSPDGSPVTEEVLSRVERLITEIAIDNSLLVAVNRG